MTDELSKKFKTEYFCKDCRHSFIPFWERIFFFDRPRHVFRCKKGYKRIEEYTDPVVGSSKTKAEYENCGIMRLPHQACGPDAKLWTPKHKKDIFKFINKEHDERSNS